MTEDLKEIENLVIGGGFSAVSLLKELERTGDEYIVINAGKPIWKHLDKNDRLDFDLVSSLYSSVFTDELVDMLEKNKNLGDRFPTSKEFYEIQKKYHRMFEHKTVRAKVTHIDNYADHSIVHVDNGDKYKAKNVIAATAFRRKVHDSINKFEFNESLKDKIVVLKAVGDSANLLISKLVCLGAKVKLVSNGFVALDKQYKWGDTVSKTGNATVDQVEFHNLSKILPTYYEVIMSLGFLQSSMLPTKITEFLYGSANLATAHPKSIRQEVKKAGWRVYKNIYLRFTPFVKICRSPSNGHIFIKYWPIDTFEEQFADDLETGIKDGFLLNDLIFFIDQGWVELCPKSETSIDEASSTLSVNGKDIEYDYLIEGDREVPNIPTISYIDKSGDTQTFNYSYRNNFMGVVPQELNNIYLIGYTRPQTGGLNNIAEMQCLLVHKMLTQPNFKQQIHSNLQERISQYNKKYYPSDERAPSDHLVYYGYYTQEIAELIGIQPRLGDCKSFLDFAKFYLFPNNAHKFRQQGEYAVEGASKLVDYISDEHNHFLVGIGGLIPYTLMLANFLALIFLLPIPFWASLLTALILLPPMNLVTTLVLGNWGVPNVKRPLAFEPIPMAVLTISFITALVTGNGWFAAGGLILNFIVVKICEKRGMNRHLFCDLHSKRRPEYKTFFEKYKQAFLKVFREKEAVKG